MATNTDTTFNTLTHLPFDSGRVLTQEGRINTIICHCEGDRERVEQCLKQNQQIAGNLAVTEEQRYARDISVAKSKCAVMGLDSLKD
ncbi:hypothetical protein KKA95_03955, partial [Patescibacteria group bacterium]|nr:hypothetical protein [Patescibacteria group bacterium]